MEATIDIDIGGTFTDCFVIFGDRTVRAKTPTTTYDLSVAFRKAVGEAANQLDISIEELLQKTTAIRYSTTIAMNSLIQRTGPKLGLITTAGHEHVLLIGRARQWADGLHSRQWRYMYLMRKPEPLIPIEMTVGVRERIDCFGKVILPIDKEDVRQKVRSLVDRGARGFVVSLLWSFLNPRHEQMVREVIQEEYPDPYLGNMPILLSSDVQPKWHEYPRTNVVVLSGYLHTDLTEQLSALGEGLRDLGYRKPLNIINNRGGVAKVSRTSAVDTYGAGPIAGLLGTAYLSKIYDLPKVVSSDMGGTSFDYGLVINGEVPFYQDWPVIDRWATESSMIEVATIGAGGGSIAWLNKLIGNKLEVGPTSAGANPGPACYDLGGSEPTVTDADVVLGYVDPDNFLGGKIRLSKERAIQALEKIAKPLGLTPEEAASEIRDVIDGTMGSTLFHAVTLKGFDPSGFTLWAYGGAGPTHCVGYNRHLGAAKIMVSPNASVFCAQGGATMDLKHAYEASRHVILYSRIRKEPYLEDFEEFNEIVDRLQGLAFRDATAAGFRAEDLVLSLELDMRYGNALVLTRVVSPRLSLRWNEDVKAVCDAFYRTFIKRYTEVAVTPEASINIESFYLYASVVLPKLKLKSFEPGSPSAKGALRGTRPVYWKEDRSFTQTRIYDADLLRPRNVVHGPAIIEARDTTVVIPSGFKYRSDMYLTGIIDKE